MTHDQANEHLFNVHETTYVAGTTTELLYVASGGSTDWAYGEAKIPYVYCVELRDTGIHPLILSIRSIKIC